MSKIPKLKKSNHSIGNVGNFQKQIELLSNSNAELKDQLKQKDDEIAKFNSFCKITDVLTESSGDGIANMKMSHDFVGDGQTHANEMVSVLQKRLNHLERTLEEKQKQIDKYEKLLEVRKDFIDFLDQKDVIHQNISKELNRKEALLVKSEQEFSLMEQKVCGLGQLMVSKNNKLRDYEKDLIALKVNDENHLKIREKLEEEIKRLQFNNIQLKTYFDKIFVTKILKKLAK